MRCTSLLVALIAASQTGGAASKFTADRAAGEALLDAESLLASLADQINHVPAASSGMLQNNAAEASALLAADHYVGQPKSAHNVLVNPVCVARWSLHLLLSRFLPASFRSSSSLLAPTSRPSPLSLSLSLSLALSFRQLSHRWRFDEKNAPRDAQLPRSFWAAAAGRDVRRSRVVVVRAVVCSTAQQHGVRDCRGTLRVHRERRGARRGGGGDDCPRHARGSKC